MGRPNIDGLDPGARRDLLILLAKAKDAGIPVTVTSAHRTREEQSALYANRARNPYPVAKPGSSRHESGLAADVHVPKAHRQKFNELAAAHGYKWHGAGDPVHYEYGGKAAKAPSLTPDALGGGKPKEADPYALYRTPPKKAESDPYALYRTSAPKAAEDPYALYRTPPKPAAAPPKKKSYGPLDYAGSLGNAYNAYLNELAEQGKNVPSLIDDPIGALRATPGALGAALSEGRAHFGPEAVAPRHLRTMLGMKEGETGRGAYNAVAVLDYLTSLGTDPTNIVAGPVMKGIGKAVEATTIPARLGRVAEGAKAQAAAQAAARAQATAKTAYASAKAKGAGRETLRGLAGELAQAKAARKAADEAAAQLAEGSRAAALGVAGAKTKPATLAVGAEQSAAAHLKQEGTKLTKARRAVVGHIKGALLSNLGTAATNVGGLAVMAEHALREAGVPIATFLGRTKGSRAALATWRKTKQETGDLAELLQHAPGILETPAILGQKAGQVTKNPILKAQQHADELAKLNLFSALKPTLGAEEAAKRVKTLLFDYSDVPAIVKVLDRDGRALFGSFSYAAGRAMLDAVVRRPDLIARYPRLQQQLLQEFPGSEEAFKKLKPYQRENLPVPTGGESFVDVSRYHPLSQFTDIGKAIKGTIGVDPGEGPPGPMAVVERTALGPTARALQKVEWQKGAPPAEKARALVSELVQSHFPQYRDLLRWRAALEGTARSDRRTAAPQTVGEAALQSVGATSARGEVEPERRRRLGGEITARARAARPLIAALDQALSSGALKNPFAGEAAKKENFDDARRAFMDSRTHLRMMLTSPRNITAEGKITPNGRARIRDAYLRTLALREAVRRTRRDVD